MEQLLADAAMMLRKKMLFIQILVMNSQLNSHFQLIHHI